MLGVQEGKAKGEWKRGRGKEIGEWKRGRRKGKGEWESMEKGKRESERRVEKGKRERERRVERGKREREGKVEKGEEGKGSLKSPVFLSIRLFSPILIVCLLMHSGQSSGFFERLSRAEVLAEEEGRRSAISSLMASQKA